MFESRFITIHQILYSKEVEDSSGWLGFQNKEDSVRSKSGFTIASSNFHYHVLVFVDHPAKRFQASYHLKVIRMYFGVCPEI